MNIIEFCKANDIQWFPVHLRILGKRGEHSRYKSFHFFNLPRINFKSPPHLIKERQEMMNDPEISKQFNGICIDTTYINELDVDTPNYPPRIQQLLETAPHYASCVRPWGKHIFCNVAGKPEGMEFIHKWKETGVEIICGTTTFTFLDTIVSNATSPIPTIQYEPSEDKTLTKYDIQMLKRADRDLKSPDDEDY